jgi:hypothetical protein
MMNEQYSITNEGILMEPIDLKSLDFHNRTVNDLRKYIPVTTSA